MCIRDSVVPAVRGDALAVTEKLPASLGRPMARSDNATSNWEKLLIMRFYLVQNSTIGVLTDSRRKGKNPFFSFADRPLWSVKMSEERLVTPAYPSQHYSLLRKNIGNHSPNPICKVSHAMDTVLK